MLNNGIRELGQSAPWFTYYREIDALFGEDPDVKVEFVEDDKTIKMYVNGQDKADAIEHLLPKKKHFGNITVNIVVIPANTTATIQKIDYIERAFRGNPIFSYIYRVPIDMSQSNPMSFCVFGKAGYAQFWNDNYGDPHGNVSIMYEDLARDVLGSDGGVFYCTDTKSDKSMAVG